MTPTDRPYDERPAAGPIYREPTPEEAVVAAATQQAAQAVIQQNAAVAQAAAARKAEGDARIGGIVASQKRLTKTLLIIFAITVPLTMFLASYGSSMETLNGKAECLVYAYRCANLPLTPEGYALQAWSLFPALTATIAWVILFMRFFFPAGGTATRRHHQTLNADRFPADQPRHLVDALGRECWRRVLRSGYLRPQPVGESSADSASTPAPPSPKSGAGECNTPDNLSTTPTLKMNRTEFVPSGQPEGTQCPLFPNKASSRSPCPTPSWQPG